MAQREDIQIASHGGILDAWMYPAIGVQRNEQSPVIILAQGLGGTKDMRLFEYCERFSAAGFVCVVFDYRYWGKSTGQPRGLVDVEAQLADWNTVIDYAAKLPQVDPERIGIFGSSFCGGHVIRLAATNPKVKATVSQCPFTDGFASTCAIGLAPLPKLAWLALRDVFWSTQANPVRVPLLGDPGEAALMSTEECKPGYQRLLPPGMTQLEIDAVPARLILHMPFLYPGAYAKSVPTPIYFAICGRDTVTPPDASLKFVKLAPKGTIEIYKESNHFDIYVGQLFERAIADYIAFFKKNLAAN
ncbi:hypothetical protein MYAM1_003155 [Malassezia yamatoensis]|uniref:Xaa-Pro dipeptidyl-peptidase-like domain-containing protein n=1 Tax=Malassezia yamatoensis TaxID=253288 RepID=A0AAJ6CIM0_9BASI|nr:hypothetical protein MYAM1_003155 [Malassezia yamatoensis]